VLAEYNTRNQLAHSRLSGGPEAVVVQNQWWARWTRTTYLRGNPRVNGVNR